MQKIIGSILILFMSLTGGCNQSEKSDVEIKLPDSQKQIDGLKKQIDDLNVRVEGLVIQQASFRNHSVFLDPTTRNFSFYENGMIKLAVQIEKIEQRADSVEITMLIGNITSANLVDAKFKVKYGIRQPKDVTADIAPWMNALQETEFSILKPLRAATWTKVIATLPNIKTESFGYFEIDDVENTKIILYSP